jgi:Subtilisin-like serine proteases
MSKTLPIQQVQFRGELDQFLTEGCGSSKLPNWVNEENITANILRVSVHLEELEHLFEKREANALPILTIVDIYKEATAKSHRLAIHSMVDVNKKRNVLGTTTLGKLLVKIDTKSDLDAIAKKFNLQNNNPSKNLQKGLSAVTDIKRYQPIIDDNIRADEVLKVQLVDYLNSEMNIRSKRLLRAFCDKNRIEMDELNYASELRLFKLKNLSIEQVAELVTMDGVLSVRKMPTIEFQSAPEPEESEIEVMIPQEGMDYPIVGVLDSGIADIPYMSPWIFQEDNVGDLLSEDIDKRHGTAVASIINYGDFLENKNLTQCGPCKILSCIVNGKACIYEHELVMNLQRAVGNHPEVKVWNLSQGLDSQIDDTEFSDLAIALDSLQKQYNVLICKSAGNINDPSDTSKSFRLNKGADSVMSLVVGSIAHAKTTERDSEVNDRSPFSRIGPGVENITKPDLVHYGGNWDTHISFFSIYGRQLNSGKGTSFSTPRVTSLAANLQHKLSGSFDPLLIRAILVHNATYPININKPTDELRREMGFGLPVPLDEVLLNDSDESTMIFCHTMDKGTNVLSLDFAFPESMVDSEGYYYGDITVTLVTDPVLLPNQGNEYCQSQVDVLLETFDHVNHVDLSQPTVMRNEERMSDGAINVLNEGFYRKPAFKTNNAAERILIEKGNKYQPIKKYHVSLSEMTPANKKKALLQGKKWALKLVGLYRQAAEISRELDGIDISQKIVLIVTIKDPKKRGVIYNECKQLLGNRGYVHNDIEIRNTIQVDNNNLGDQ